MPTTDDERGAVAAVSQVCGVWEEGGECKVRIIECKVRIIECTVRIIECDVRIYVFHHKRPLIFVGVVGRQIHVRPEHVKQPSPVSARQHGVQQRRGR